MFDVTQQAKCGVCGKTYTYVCSSCFINEKLKNQCLQGYYTQWWHAGTWSVMKRDLSGDCLMYLGSLADCKSWITNKKKENKDG